MTILKWFTILSTLFMRGISCESPLTVCEALSQRHALHQKEVWIRGEWVQDEDNSYLVDSACKAVRVGDREWPPRVFVSAAVGHRFEARIRNEERVRPQLERLERASRAELGRGRAVRTIISFLGTFETIPLTQEGDASRLVGLGHSGGYVARIVYHDVCKPAMSISRSTARK